MKQKAFTLVDLLLAVVLVGLLYSAVFGLLDQASPHNKLDEGLVQLHTLLIYVKAVAETEGCRVVIDFPDGAGVSVSWETDPFNLPGRFTSFEPARVYTTVINEQLTIFSEQGSRDDEPVPTLTFYPDGTGELSTVLTVQSKDARDSRRFPIKFPHVVIPIQSTSD